MENGFSSPRTDAFPAGLHVLVVDDDPTWLKILEKMLNKCSYEVTTCGSARDALSLLRERKDGFDIVITDANMPNMDGFKLVEHVGLEMDLPVIMMSKDGETGLVLKGIQHGACDYLLKPIRMKELRMIWQHVFRKKIQMAKIGCGLSDEGHFFHGQDTTLIEKRKGVESENDGKDPSDSSSSKKPRAVWSVDLHQIFIEAVNQIGLDKVGPKKILELMNVPLLTRDDVSNHLQKYHLYLSRIQKFNDSKHSPVSLTESVGSFALSFSGSCSSTRSITATECSCNKEASNVTEWSGTSVDHLYTYKEVRAKYTFNGGHETREQEQEDEVVSKLVMAPEIVSSLDGANRSSNAEPNSSHSTSSKSSAGSGAKAAAFDSTFLFRKSHNDEHK